VREKNLINILKEELNFQIKLKELTEIFIGEKSLDSLLKIFLDKIDEIVPSVSSNVALIENGKVTNKAAKGYEKIWNIRFH